MIVDVELNFLHKFFDEVEEYAQIDRDMLHCKMWDGAPWPCQPGDQRLYLFNHRGHKSLALQSDIEIIGKWLEEINPNTLTFLSFPWHEDKEGVEPNTWPCIFHVHYDRCHEGVVPNPHWNEPNY